MVSLVYDFVDEEEVFLKPLQIIYCLFTPSFLCIYSIVPDSCTLTFRSTYGLHGLLPSNTLLCLYTLLHSLHTLCYLWYCCAHGVPPKYDYSLMEECASNTEMTIRTRLCN